jgi:radical SAM superfamily enzyme YgiQ (UPF0313 family)
MRVSDGNIEEVNMAMDEIRFAMVNQAFVPPGMKIGETGAHLPGLGLLMLASAIREVQPQWSNKIQYFDEEHLGEEECVAVVKSWLQGAKIGVVMLTTYTLTHARQREFCDAVRTEGVYVFAGGPHVTLHPTTSNANYVVRGEGVSAMREIFSSENWTGEFPVTASGLMKSEIDDEGKVTWPVSEPPMRKLDPNMWPKPSFAYDLIHSEVKHRASQKRKMGNLEPISIILSKGCPEACHFCTSGAQNGKWAPRSVGRFKDDLAYLLTHRNVEALEFHDDDFLAHPELPMILTLLKECGIPWNCYGRVNHFYENGQMLAFQLADSGCKRIFLGLESMNDEKLEFFNKRATGKMNKIAVHSCFNAGIEVAAGWIIGAPNDTYGTLQDELESFLALPLYSLDVNILSLNPGSVHTKKIFNGKIELPSGQYSENDQQYLIDSGAIIPDTEKFGELEPWGQPTICKIIDKIDLNEFAQYARAELHRVFPVVIVRNVEILHISE